MANTPAPVGGINWDMVMSVGTKLAIIAGAPLVAKNVLTQDQLNALVGTIPTIAGAIGVAAPIVYGIWKTMRAQKIAAAAALPGAVVVLDSQKEADAHPNASVIGPTDPLPKSP